MPAVQAILDKKGSHVVSLVAGESVVNAARLMNERGIGGVVVTEDGEMVGIFTERDVLRRVVAEGRDPVTTTVGDVMTSPVVTCRADTKLEECSAVMTNKRIRHLPVVDDSGVTGILTIGDLLAFRVQDQEATIEHLNNYIFDLR
ncbi:MAG: CBS domain-containing protein [Gemmatimonadales bacterium]